MCQAKIWNRLFLCIKIEIWGWEKKENYCHRTKFVSLSSPPLLFPPPPQQPPPATILSSDIIEYLLTYQGLLFVHLFSASCAAKVAVATWLNPHKTLPQAPPPPQLSDCCISSAIARGSAATASHTRNSMVNNRGNRKVFAFYTQKFYPPTSSSSS